MKIVSVMTTVADGGAEFAAVEMFDALAARGHDVVLLTDRPSIARDADIRVEHVDLGPKLSGATWKRLLLLYLPYRRRLRKALELEAPYDVLLLHYKKEQLMASELPERLRATLVWSEWGPVPVQMRQGLTRRAYLRAAENVDLVMAISAGTRDSVVEVGVDPSKVQYVPNVMRVEDLGFSAEGRARVRSELGIPEDAFVVGLVSRFHPKKRNDVVIEAVKRLNDGAHVILGGSGETEADLRRLAEPLGERAHFIPTPKDDVAEVMSSFDVSVFCPSPAEGAPRAVLLAMLASRPSVSTGAMGVADIITEGVGEIVSPENDPDALAETLRRYQEDPERRRSEGAEGRRRAEAEYDAPILAERIERLFREAGAT